MPSPANLLPIYGSGSELLGYVSPAAAQRMLEAGHVIPRGTKHRIRALIATHNNVDLVESLRPPTGTRFSHDHETDQNPRGVWTFRKQVEIQTKRNY